MLEKLTQDPATSTETKAQAQRSINELNTAINVIKNMPQTLPVDYVTIQGSGMGVGVNASVNLLNGEVFVGGAKSNLAPGASGSVVVGRMVTDVPPEKMPASIKNQMTKDLEAMFGAGSGAEKMAKELIESGRSVPVPMQATSDTKLYKLMANDDPRTPSSTTPYFVDAAQLQRLQKNPSLANDILGLPSSSQAPVFKVYEVQPQPNTTPTVYQSDVATATSKAGSAVVGNAKQTLVPDRSQWTEPKLTNIKIGGK